MGQTPEEIREMEHMHIKMSYNKIEELIYAGNNICCQLLDGIIKKNYMMMQ